MDLISRQAAIDALERSKDKTAKGDIGGFYNTIIQNDIDKIKALPSAQPEIVRCNDCRYWQDQEEGVIEVPICARPTAPRDKFPFVMMINGEGFCSFAKKKEVD